MDRKQINARLQELGLYSKYYMRRELKLLPQVLLEGEILNCVLTGICDGSRQMLAVTDRRLLLLSSAALTPAACTSILRSAVTGWELQKRFLFSTITVTAKEKQLKLTGVHTGSADVFLWAMKQPLPLASARMLCQITSI